MGWFCEIYFWRLKPTKLQRQAGIAYVMQSTLPWGPRYFIRAKDLRV
jgi:hypothetical protein